MPIWTVLLGVTEVRVFAPFPRRLLAKKLAYTVLTAAMAGGLALGSTGTASAAHPEPATKDDCRNGGFAEYKVGFTDEQRFDNQGQCIRFVETGKG